MHFSFFISGNHNWVIKWKIKSSAWRKHSSHPSVGLRGLIPPLLMLHFINKSQWSLWACHAHAVSCSAPCWWVQATARTTRNRTEAQLEEQVPALLTKMAPFALNVSLSLMLLSWKEWPLTSRCRGQLILVRVESGACEGSLVSPMFRSVHSLLQPLCPLSSRLFVLWVDQPLSQSVARRHDKQKCDARGEFDCNLIFLKKKCIKN